MHEKSLIKVINAFGLSDLEELLIEIGKGNIKSRDVLNFLYPEKENLKNKLPILKKPHLQETMKIKGLISGMATHYAHCCHPPASASRPPFLAGFPRNARSAGPTAARDPPYFLVFPSGK